jgi:hypothetical protein
MKTVQERFMEGFTEIENTHDLTFLTSFAFSNSGQIFVADSENDAIPIQPGVRQLCFL